MGQQSIRESLIWANDNNVYGRGTESKTDIDHSILTSIFKAQMIEQ